MPTWNEVDTDINSRIAEGKSVDLVCDELRRDYLSNLSAYVGRPVIAYYSGFLQKPPHPALSINDFDMNGLMAVIHNVERDKGLDIILHTPGGGIEAARAIVEYLYAMFGKDIRAIVPQIAMSAGTMIACATKQIVMGKHSSLGPTDPQVNGVPATGVIHEIERALDEIKKDPIRQVVWQEIFRQFPPSFISNCERSLTGSKKMVTSWLAENMFSESQDATKKAEKAVSELTNYSKTTEHGHHFMKDACCNFGLDVFSLEDDQDFQELVLSVHHAYVASFARVKSLKFIENSIGASWNVSSD
ncbi:SDH family Clp fold serine proteinase [Pacificoceanicola onchidii]|uniref:SDH family Clp fold serine proteinase n=1 Tax=Pacificoceanicola onchidii TaxID=2562685 RepID=UPI0010A6A0C7|nr:ATP-dependent Clp protease proteolytic subunit [Pacificoceanicola onchidii]